MWLILFMIVIGAVIGGVTNSLAIKMLFRPYSEKRIGRFRLPFTPGLIPKRHDELATQLGRMVVSYLVTSVGIGKKLTEASFTDSVTEWAKRESRKFLSSDQSLSSILHQNFQVEDSEKLVLQQVERWLETSYDRWFREANSRTIGMALPEVIVEKVERNLPAIRRMLLTKARDYVASDQGKAQLSVMIDRFLETHGTLGNMVSMFFSNERLVDKLHPELLKFLNDQETEKWLQKLLDNEWERLKEKPLADIQQYVEKEAVVRIGRQVLQTQVPVIQWLGKPLHAWTGPYEEKVAEEWVPKLVHVTIQLLVSQLDHMLERLHLEEIVREQVSAFSVERLEELVLSISRKEFKMITYLGALLGGGIGLVQSLIILLIK
ncbi:DUF445 family protein [Halalkalibacterium halodurans]|uniref:UPF0754 membrane protein BH1148 n=1 Tax=Halalkalibacterium halodurans (strain ATCC BAA-125 / DSM 18197 / FERM 7344 / JCM 9153 / C-125) TaxID=272558 RepID=Y1148_HALH5|nr:DUF445 domain-containing protein [Halalkalibacterium halodurans]Q9KDR3.2 RecName: Full=UPF0754 membrane protein BH1148 [Halalkalibacterium halodurans C-125]MED4171614.1 DUF445 family protein [Halalkalibacterium halodurans]